MNQTKKFMIKATFALLGNLVALVWAVIFLWFICQPHKLEQIWNWMWK